MQYTHSRHTKYHRFFIILLGLAFTSILILFISKVPFQKQKTVVTQVAQISPDDLDFIFSVSFFDQEQAYTYDVVSHQKKVLVSTTTKDPLINISVTDQKLVTVATAAGTNVFDFNPLATKQKTAKPRDQYTSPNQRYSFSLVQQNTNAFLQITDSKHNTSEKIPWKERVQPIVLGWSQDNTKALLSIENPTTYYSPQSIFLLDIPRQTLESFQFDTTIGDIQSIIMPKNSNILYILASNGLFLQDITQTTAKKEPLPSDIFQAMTAVVINNQNPDQLLYSSRNSLISYSLDTGAKQILYTNFEKQQSFIPLGWNGTQIVYLSSYTKTQGQTSQYELDLNYLNTKNQYIQTILYLTSAKAIPSSAIQFISWLRDRYTPIAL